MWTIAARHRFWLAAWSVVAVTTLLAPQVASASKRDARVVAQPRLVWHKSFATAQAEARRRGVPLLIHFHASWCGPCRRMERDVLDTRALAADGGAWGGRGQQVLGLEPEWLRGAGLCPLAPLLYRVRPTTGPAAHGPTWALGPSHKIHICYTITYI